jgi:hypothetical protein
MIINEVPKLPQPQASIRDEIAIFGIIIEGWAVIWYAIFLIFIASGCGSSTEIVSPELQARASELSALLTSTKTVETKSDEILVAISEVKTQVETLEASLVLPNPNGKEGDPESALDPVPTSPVDDITPIAAGRGYLTSDGTRLRWDVNGNKNPDILQTSAHLRQDHDIDTNGMTHQQMADIHADIHDGKKVATRAVRLSCPNGRCPTSTRQRRGLFGLFR